MHKEYILLNGFRKAKRDFTAGFHVPLIGSTDPNRLYIDHFVLYNCYFFVCFVYTFFFN